MPMPYAPVVPPLTGATYRAARRAEARAPSPQDVPAPPIRYRGDNRRPGRDTPSRVHLRNGRTGALEPGRVTRARHGTRV
ncbi:hypothetical protein C6W10_11285 [Plantactinospora sp. BB1]|nr:hypothetical protein C6W10_11285 [Plantactinospora sp. BB1]